MRLTGSIPKQSNSTAQIRPPPWLNLRRKPELDLLPLELDFLYGDNLRQRINRGDSDSQGRGVARATCCRFFATVLFTPRGDGRQRGPPNREEEEDGMGPHPPSPTHSCARLCMYSELQNYCVEHCQNMVCLRFRPSLARPGDKLNTTTRLGQPLAQ